MRRKKILTAGPSISPKELRYVLDAVKRGWNESWDDYLRAFEEKFSKYIGVKYALPTSSCTGALHLSLLALGVGPGDEVIVPDLTWVATASVVTYTGAKPVFADVEADTWCLDPESIKQRLSYKTKAIIPVHLYGHSCDMTAINNIARKKKLYVLEDAAPSLGGTYQGKRTGSLGDVGAFSFQGAKIMVTGEGGMLVTNNRKIYKRAHFLGNHGKSTRRNLWIEETGYKYNMSNIQAALGLAQLERMHEFLMKKRRIYSWYKKSFNHIDGISLNTERPDVKNIFWMSSIVLDGAFKNSRDHLAKKLFQAGIDTRPFFYPVSSFPMYKRQKNPVSYKLSRRGINLPSGVHLKENDIDRVTSAIKKFLGV